MNMKSMALKVRGMRVFLEIRKKFCSRNIITAYTVWKAERWRRRGTQPNGAWAGLSGYRNSTKRRAASCAYCDAFRDNPILTL